MIGRIILYPAARVNHIYNWDRKTIRSIYNLEELVRRPVLLDMAVKSLPTLRERKDEVTAAGLYDVYTGFWIHRDHWRAILTPAGKATFTEELAWRLWTTDQERLHYSELTDLAQELLRAEHFKPGAVSATTLSQADIEYAAHEVRTAALLTRDAAGNYGFAHRSFMEFFVARRLVQGLLDGSAPEVTISEAIRGFVHGLLAEADWPPPPPPGMEVPEGMVWVPPGPFIYGEGKGTRVVRLEQGFFVARTPVTNAEYARFVADTGHEPPIHWKGKAPPKKIADHPVTRISWRDAAAYGEWAGKRLPTEEEWEKAARGSDGREYPWGDQEPTPELCNFGGNEGGTTPVGKYSPQGDSPYGCVDMAGNVWEWTASDYDKSNKVLRGGSWGNNLWFARCAYRNWSNPRRRDNSVGFRCARGSL